MTRSQRINYALYQSGWFACILGAAWDRPIAGFLIAVVLTAVHLHLSADRARETRAILLALALGLVVEGFQVWSGTYRFRSGAVVAWMSPPWLLMMWAQFATTFRSSLRSIMTVPVRAALFGLVGGPIAFLAGERLGAVTLARPLAPGLVRLGLAWGFALAVCALWAREPVGSGPGRAESAPS
ncbi:MAG: DUF2878 domain-containing protein [Gemmatimonadetes bacterium]|nr:DUF2878 domain-containing protein [Gemmatimonadota bacterium]